MVRSAKRVSNHEAGRLHPSRRSLRSLLRMRRKSNRTSPAMTRFRCAMRAGATNPFQKPIRIPERQIMCQQWLSVAGHLLQLIGFLLVAYELRHVVAGKTSAKTGTKTSAKKAQGRFALYALGVALVAVGLLAQTAGGWVGRIPLDFFKSCY